MECAWEGKGHRRTVGWTNEPTDFQEIGRWNNGLKAIPSVVGGSAAVINVWSERAIKRVHSSTGIEFHSGRSRQVGPAIIIWWMDNGCCCHRGRITCLSELEMGYLENLSSLWSFCFLNFKGFLRHFRIGLSWCHGLQQTVNSAPNPANIFKIQHHITYKNC